MKLPPRRLLGAVLDTIRNLMPSNDPAMIALEKLHERVRVYRGDDMNPPVLDVRMALVLTMTATFAALAVLNLVLAGAHGLPDRRIAALLVK